MRKILVTIAAATALALIPATANADTITNEAGTFFENGTCVSGDEGGFWSATPEVCVTPTVYDELFSFENLDSIESQRPGEEGKSIAEVSGLVDDGVAASDRPLGEGLVEEPKSYKELVYVAGLPIRLA